MARIRFARVVLGAALLWSGPARAADEISTDITADLSGTVANDEDVVEDTGSGAPTKIDLGSLPAAADVTGYSIAVGGDILLSFETTTSLPGGITAAPNDVVRWNGSSYSTEFRGSDHAIPPGAAIDAIGVVGNDLLLSFDVTVALGALTVEDEDLVRLESTQPDVWSLYFDGSAHGVPAGADLDGADVIDATGHLALSFDISGTVGAVAFDDEDVLDFDPGADAWSMRYDGSAHHAALASADVDAVFSPEPSGAGLAAAVVLAGLALRRSRLGLARAGGAENGGKS